MTTTESGLVKNSDFLVRTILRSCGTYAQTLFWYLSGTHTTLGRRDLPNLGGYDSLLDDAGHYPAVFWRELGNNSILEWKWAFDSQVRISGCCRSKLQLT